MVLSVSGDRVSVSSAHVAFVGATVNGRITVQHFAPVSFVRHANAVAPARYRREVTGDHDRAGSVFAKPHEGQDTIVGVVGINPAPALGEEVSLVECGLGTVKRIQVAYPSLHSLVRRGPECMPINAAVVVPFAPLGNLATHE